jgi:hypothetical protein
MHDKQLEMRRIQVTNFCEAEDKGLIQILIALDENADAIGLDLEDKQIIEDMLNILPDKINSLKSMAVSSSRKAQAERDLREMIRKFIKKPCKEFLKKYNREDYEEETVSAPLQSKIRDPKFDQTEKQTMVSNSIEKIRKTSRQFYELTDLLLDIRYGVDLCIIHSDNTLLKSFAVGYVSLSENFKTYHKNLMEDIKNDLPDNVWKNISDTEPKLSAHIDKLIDDFNNIIDKKTDISSTMNNLRREYKSLWSYLWRVAL